MHFHGSIVAVNRPPEPGLAFSIASKNGRVRATGNVASSSTRADEAAGEDRALDLEPGTDLGDEVVERRRVLLVARYALAHALGQRVDLARSAARWASGSVERRRSR